MISSKNKPKPEDALIAKIESKLKSKQCDTYRIIHENELYTMDYNSTRYNVVIDESLKILRDWIG